MIVHGLICYVFAVITICCIFVASLLVLVYLFRAWRQIPVADHPLAAAAAGVGARGDRLPGDPGRDVLIVIVTVITQTVIIMTVIVVTVIVVIRIITIVLLVIVRVITLSIKQRGPNPNKDSLVRNNAANVEWDPLHVDVSFLIKESSLGLGSLCLLLILGSRARREGRKRRAGRHAHAQPRAGPPA